MHGGKIGAYSPGLNEGSKFYVDLPWDNMNVSRPHVSLDEVGGLPRIQEESLYDPENGVTLLEGSFISGGGNIVSARSFLGVERPLQNLLGIDDQDGEFPDIFLDYEKQDIDDSIGSSHES